MSDDSFRAYAWRDDTHDRVITTGAGSTTIKRGETALLLVGDRAERVLAFLAASEPLSGPEMEMAASHHMGPPQ